MPHSEPYSPVQNHSGSPFNPVQANYHPKVEHLESRIEDILSNEITAQVLNQKLQLFETAKKYLEITEFYRKRTSQRDKSKTVRWEQ